MNKIDRRMIVSVRLVDSSFTIIFFFVSFSLTNFSTFLGIKSGNCSLRNDVSSKFLELLFDDTELSKTEMFSRLVLTVSRSMLGVGEGHPISASRAVTVLSSSAMSQQSWYGLNISSQLVVTLVSQLATDLQDSSQDWTQFVLFNFYPMLTTWKVQEPLGFRDQDTRSHSILFYHLNSSRNFQLVL